MAATTRLGCLVPGCAHTRGDWKGDPITPGHEWICAVHWASVPSRLRAIYARTRRRYARADATFQALYVAQGNTFRWPQIEPPTRAWNAQRRIWRRLKRYAIERAMGL